QVPPPSGFRPSAKPLGRARTRRDQRKFHFGKAGACVGANGLVMGEKLLAQRLLSLLRDTIGGNSRAAQAVLEWAADQSGWLWPQLESGTNLCWEGLPALVQAIDTDEAPAPLAGCVDAVVRLLELDSFEAALLEAAVALSRGRRLSSLRMRLIAAGEDVALLTARAAGARPDDAAARLRASAPLSLGLLCLSTEMPLGGLDLAVAWPFGQLLDKGLTDDSRMVEALAGLPQTASLTPADFV